MRTKRATNESSELIRGRFASIVRRASVVRLRFARVALVWCAGGWRVSAEARVDRGNCSLCWSHCGAGAVRKRGTQLDRGRYALPLVAGRSCDSLPRNAHFPPSPATTITYLGALRNLRMTTVRVLTDCARHAWCVRTVWSPRARGKMIRAARCGLAPSLSACARCCSLTAVLLPPLLLAPARADR